MREALGITKAVDILDHVHSLPDEEQQKAQKALEDIEREAMVQIVCFDIRICLFSYADYGNIDPTAGPS